MGLFKRSQTSPEGADLEDIANHWKEVDRGQAGKDIKEMGEFHKPWGEGAIVSMAAEQPPAVAIAGGSNGGGKTGPDAGTLPESRRIRDALFFDITEAYSQWRQRLQERRYKPSMRINLLPSKKELKSYSKAKEAYYSDGNIRRAIRILEDAGCGYGTIGESCKRWHQLRLRHVKVSPEPEMEPEPIVKEQVPRLVYIAERYSGTAERNEGCFGRFVRGMREYVPKRRKRFDYALLGLSLLTGLAIGSVGYQYIVNPYVSHQVSIQRPSQIAQQKPEARPSAPKREPDAPAAPEQQKPGFYQPIAPPATQPGTTEPPRAKVQETAAPTAAPKKETPAPAQPTRPAPTQKVFFYRDEYGARRELPVYNSRWTIDKVSAGNEGENRARLLLETFYDVNRDGYNDNFEPQLPIELKGYLHQEAEEMRSKLEACKYQKQTVYVILGGSVYTQRDKNENVLGILTIKDNVTFRSQGCLN